ncbi:MAG: hypothetical protein KDC18_15920 [Alphaproteobacteria bacterium]|nr:hypothetical protein [Alphaproteobacteria bacterium]MCB9931084.1 hypothetical protein [Alphaproteobacteria bacterium]
MRRPASMRGLEDLARVRLSPHFFLRDFLYSEIAALYGIPNIPDDPDLAIAAGRRLCAELLEPLWHSFGGLHLRSGFRSVAVNDFGNALDLNCAQSEKDFAGHIWDRRDAAGRMGACVTVVVPWFLPLYEATGDWRPLAWWVHDHLPYHRMLFFPKLAAFNLTWREAPERRIDSHAAPQRGCLTRPGMANHAGSHAAAYEGFPPLCRG